MKLFNSKLGKMGVWLEVICGVVEVVVATPPVKTQQMMVKTQPMLVVRDMIVAMVLLELVIQTVLVTSDYAIASWGHPKLYGMTLSYKLCVSIANLITSNDSQTSHYSLFYKNINF